MSALTSMVIVTLWEVNKRTKKWLTARKGKKILKKRR
jgi:hypothetical protein